MADEESEYSEESYYEEVTEYDEEEYVEEEVAQASPQTRPVHPLFGGGGAKNALTAAAQSLNKAPIQEVSSTSVSKNNSQTNINKQKLGSSGPPGLAEQVAAMAAKRSARLSNDNDPAETASKEIVDEPPTSTTESKPATVIKTKTKKGWFPQSSTSAQPKEQAKPMKTKKIVYKVPAPNTAPETESKSPAFTQVKLKPSQANKNNTRTADVPPSPPANNESFKTKLRTTGIDTKAPPKQVLLETPEQPPAPEEKKIVNVPYETHETETVTTTKRVVKHNEPHKVETVEYKVGCFCTVM